MCFSVLLNIYLPHLLVATWHIRSIKNKHNMVCLFFNINNKHKKHLGDVAIAQQLFWRSYICSSFTLTSVRSSRSPSRMCHSILSRLVPYAILPLHGLPLSTVSLSYAQRQQITVKLSINSFKTMDVPGNTVVFMDLPKYGLFHFIFQLSDWLYFIAPFPVQIWDVDAFQEYAKN